MNTEIPFDILYDPVPVECGPFVPCVQKVTNPSATGDFFLGITNPESGRCVARVSAIETVDREDMGLAYLFAASPDLLYMCEMVEALFDALVDANREDLQLADNLKPFRENIAAAIAKAKGEI